MQRRLIANRWMCPDGTIIQSKYRHDFVSHQDDYFVDGGLDYVKLAGCGAARMKDMCVYSDDPHEMKREAFMWGTRGKDGMQLLQWVVLKDLQTEHIEAIIETQTHIPEHIREMFVDELQYRKGQNVNY